MIRKLRSLLRDRKGSVAVEFGLTFPALLFATMFIFDVGFGMYSFSTLSNAASDAARMGSVRAEQVLDDQTGEWVRVIDTDTLASIKAYAEQRLSTMAGTQVVTATVVNGTDGPALQIIITYDHKFFLGSLFGMDHVQMTAEGRMLML